jgi:C1A family cysteine protease
MSEAERAFIGFVSKYHRTYGTKEEYNFRLQEFAKNYNQMMHHNMMNSATDGYHMGINNFADMTEAEYNMMLGFKKNHNKKHFTTFKMMTDAAPASVDWRSKNAVTPVKNQGSCGSCWAFSATGSMEGAYAIKTGQLTSFSEQQLVDCSTAQGNMGCNGGLMDYAFTYLESNAIETEASYPYTGRDGKCTYETSKGVDVVVSFTDVPANDPAQLQAAAAQQPVSVAIEADRMVFQMYTGGIIKSTQCGTNLDHGVLVVGYGTDAGQDYWLLKNSWGPSWGEQGFFRIARDMTTKGPGICGLQQQASYPIAK